MYIYIYIYIYLFDWVVFKCHLAAVCTFFAAHSNTMASGGVYITVHLSLTEQALSVTKTVRWRGRLREILAQCPPDTVVKVNKELRVLEITSTPEGVQIAQRQVEERLGPVKELSTAVWRELLRTRQGLGALNLIQKLTDCRLHLQRHASHVRLFGSGHAVAMASSLLDHLEEMCAEAQVEAPVEKLSQSILDSIARHSCVTLQTQGSKLCLMGFKTAIQDAMEEIGKVISSPDLIPGGMGDPPNTAKEVCHLGPLMRFATQLQGPGAAWAMHAEPLGVSASSNTPTGLCYAEAVPMYSMLHLGQAPFPPQQQFAYIGQWQPGSST